ncbi:hypothetical protein FB451DRAFT_1175010 [Mycena latifolia]|nr:hypothetical protein FB451DRAFT_1175010 [Mycena latifolia]
MAREDYEDDIALIPNLTPLHNGGDVVGQDGSFYMGGVNNGLGLGEITILSTAPSSLRPPDGMQSSKLDQMMNHDDPLPEGEADLEEGEQLMAWFYDEEDQISEHGDFYEN